MTIPINLPTDLLDELPNTSTLHDVEAALVETLKGGRAALPVLPGIATQALELANDPDSSIMQFAQLVRTDPPIAARFLATANSSFYSRGREILSVNDAVGRIGMSGSRDLIFQVVYAANAAGLRKYQSLVQRSFQRSVLCGLICRISAPLLKVQVPDAYLCGLLHDIGQARIYRILSEGKVFCDDEDAKALVEKYHPRAGMELAVRWALPDDIVQVCRRHHEAGPPGSPQLRLVRFADKLAPLVEAASAPEQTLQQIALDAQDLIDLSLDSSQVEQVVERVVSIVGPQPLSSPERLSASRDI